MADTVSCPGCGASIAPTGICRFCGATGFVDGVAGKLLPSDLACPRCPGGKALKGVEHEGFRADVCTACHGVWFGPGILDEAIRAALKRPLKKGEGATTPAHGGMEPVRYALCPRCGGGMARTPFSQKPLVIIDRCPAHGDWCDGGELGQLKAAARSRGSAPARREPAPDAPAAKPRPRLGGQGDGEDPIVAIIKGRPGGGGVFTAESERLSDLARNRGTFLGLGRRRRRDLFDILADLLR
jgi:Zn-finger nucleic acid-binding protein